MADWYRYRRTMKSACGRFALKNRKAMIMNSFHRTHLAGLVCLVGGMLQIIYGLLSIPFAFAQNNLGWDEALWGLVTVGMIGGALGLLALGVARPRWIALLGATLTILGCLIRLGVIPLNILSPSDVYVPFILSSAFLLILGMSILGIATLLGKQLSGWQAWTPLLAGIFPLIALAVYEINQFVHFLLLGLWGLPWILVSYVVLTHRAKQKQAIQVQPSTRTAQ
jgi:hypothetical protein